MRILLLGGTTEASQLAQALARAGNDTVFSYAGRTAAPAPQPLPTRIGGFGGVDGLAAYLRENCITHVIDATHPFAAQISRNAIAACAHSNVALTGFERPPWQAGPGDHWTEVATLSDAVAALPDHPARVFLAIGKQHLAAFGARPQHDYLLRLVDPPQLESLRATLPHAHVVIARGPFDLAGDLALMREHRTDILVVKNAGGIGARAKLDAARKLGLPVIMIARPTLPARRVLGSVDAVMGWLHDADRGV